ncbi:hypothetical protein TWF506_008134 [Arthrobotrys conoides]|uniref:Peptidase A1 domain-containing protein n=1 Tax=Arthrobotrys conoides TaxID=74498 RepID=A0AAN8RME9_9PEZI
MKSPCTDSSHDKTPLTNTTFGTTASDTDGLDEVWARGEYFEDVVTIGGIQANLQFLAATTWNKNVFPFFGLGLSFDSYTSPITSALVYDKFPSDESFQESSYLSALYNQRKIGAKVCGLYNIMDTEIPGEIIIGGIDPSKFYEKLEFYQDSNQSYAMDFPTIQIGDMTDPLAAVTHYPETDSPRIQLSPFGPYLTLTSPAFDGLVKAFKQFGLTNCTQPEFGVEFCIPCNSPIPEKYVLKLSFKKAVIDILLKDIVQSTSQDLCPLLFIRADTQAYLGGPFFKAAYVVLEPMINRIGIAPLVRNPTSSRIVEISEGALSANLSTIQGETARTDPDPDPSSNPDPPNPDATTTTTANPSSSSDKSISLPIDAFIGIVLASAFSMAIVGAAVTAFVICRKRRRLRPMPEIPDARFSSVPQPPELSPRRSMTELGVPLDHFLRDSRNEIQELPSESQQQHIGMQLRLIPANVENVLNPKYRNIP